MGIDILNKKLNEKITESVHVSYPDNITKIIFTFCNLKIFTRLFQLICLMQTQGMLYKKNVPAHQ